MKKLPILKSISNTQIPFKNTLKTFGLVLSGTEMIIPIEILSKISLENYFKDFNFNSLFLMNYNFQQIILLSFLLSFVTYKGDRLLDAEEYFIEKNSCKNKNTKENYYSSLIKNKQIIEFTLFISYISILVILINNQDLILSLPLLISTFNYKSIKTYNFYGFPLKPLYISVLWIYVSCILPMISIQDVHYDLCLPVFLNIFATSNIADIKDYEEDFNNNISTLPTLLGKDKSKYIIIICALLSNYFFIQQDNYNLNFQNIFFLLSNFGSLFSLLKI